MKEAVEFFDNIHQFLTPHNCRENALRFSEQRFKNEINSYISEKWELFDKGKKIEY